MATTSNIYPDGDASPNEWTQEGAGAAHHDVVDETPANDADYLGTSVTLADEEFDYPTATATYISNITVYVRVYGVWTDPGGAGEARPSIGVNIYMGSAWQTQQTYQVDANSTWQNKTFSFDGTWTQADLDAIQTRCRRTSGNAPGGGGVLRFSQIYVVATYTAAGVKTIDGTAIASVKTLDGTAIASVKRIDGVLK